MVAPVKKFLIRTVGNLFPDRTNEVQGIKGLIVDLLVNLKLQKQYKKFIASWLDSDVCLSLKKEQSNKVWVCWFQGIESAPDIVKICYASLLRNLKGKEVILLTEKNIADYVTFPAHIQSKYEKGIISKAHYSDLLRLELLIQYGGVWIDATVLCTGENIPEYILKSDLFVYQWLNTGAKGCTRVASNWFIASCTNHPILRLTRALLYQYWLTNNRAIHYMIFHHFFEIATRAYPEEWKNVIPTSNVPPHILQSKLFEPYKQFCWSAMINMTDFHKLTHKFDAALIASEGTYYRYLVEGKGNLK